MSPFPKLGHLCASLLNSSTLLLFIPALIPDFPPPLCRRLIHGGQFLNGLAGPTIMSAGPFLSTTWFGPDQRATATAVASLFSYLGGSVSFLVGPLFVPAPNDTLAGAKVAAAVSNSTIQGRIQLVIYAGTIRTQWGGGAGSMAHHFYIMSALLRDTNTIRRWDSRNLPNYGPRSCQ